MGPSEEVADWKQGNVQKGVKKFSFLETFQLSELSQRDNNTKIETKNKWFQNLVKLFSCVAKDFQHIFVELFQERFAPYYMFAPYLTDRR